MNIWILRTLIFPAYSVPRRKACSFAKLFFRYCAGIVLVSEIAGLNQRCIFWLNEFYYILLQLPELSAVLLFPCFVLELFLLEEFLTLAFVLWSSVTWGQNSCFWIITKISRMSRRDCFPSVLGTWRAALWTSVFTRCGWRHWRLLSLSWVLLEKLTRGFVSTLKWRSSTSWYLMTHDDILCCFL